MAGGHAQEELRTKRTSACLRRRVRRADGNVNSYGTVVIVPPMHGQPAHAQPALRVHVAGFWSRSLAAGIDLVLLAPVLVACILTLRVALPVPGEADGEWGPWLLELLLERHWMVLAVAGFAVGVCLAYDAIFLAFFGRTIGQQVLGLRVIDDEGGSPGPTAVVLRVLALPVGLFFLGLGVLWIAFDREARGFHDHVSGTLVIHRRTQEAPDLRHPADPPVATARRPA